jgi:hypothetical protein
MNDSFFLSFTFLLSFFYERFNFYTKVFAEPSEEQMGFNIKQMQNPVASLGREAMHIVAETFYNEFFQGIDEMPLSPEYTISIEGKLIKY